MDFLVIHWSRFPSLIYCLPSHMTFFMIFKCTPRSIRIKSLAVWIDFLVHHCRRFTCLIYPIPSLTCLWFLTAQLELKVWLYEFPNPIVTAHPCPWVQIVIHFLLPSLNPGQETTLPILTTVSGTNTSIFWVKFTLWYSPHLWPKGCLDI